MENLEPEKLLQLRAKTDRQLLDLLHSKLETGLTCAGQAARLYSDGSWTSAGRSLERADQALNEVQLLLPVLTEKQRRELDPQLNILRETLERLTRQSPKSRAAMSMW